ncbi:MAG: hypothetical protein KF760_25885 [Candidatus Eremiobacteraeota bacterium]|nr:hypothetical protein [Candidatus Eremiobacteraeota bacterium]MCW5869107.1 hypothetical protein [Candidatus Eremiobacteraeota bacterium]
MFETLTITTLLLIAFFAYQNVRWGLTSAIPKDAQARLRFYCSECLTTVKQLLAGARIEHLEGERLSFNNGQQLFIREGDVILQQPGQKDRVLHTLGKRGELTFERLSDTGLMVNIRAQEAEEAHRIACRLEVEFLEPAQV